MSRIKIFVPVLLFVVALLPANAGAEGDASSVVYLPLAMSVASGPELVQFRSCGGYGKQLQFQEVSVGTLTALTEECEGGNPYPAPIAGEGEGVALGGYYIGELNWHIVPHLGLYYNQDVQFKLMLGFGGAQPPYLEVDIRDGQLHVAKGDVVYTEDTVVDAWNLSFYLEAVRPYVELRQGAHTIWIVQEDAHGILWVEVQTPRVVDDTGPEEIADAWGVWYEACLNEGEIPSGEALEEFVLNRYPLNGN